MVKKGRHKEKKAYPKTSAASFPALRQFLRGYLHQDMNEVYGSPELAARRFWQETDAEQQRAVATEWLRFLSAMKDQPLVVINRALNEDLGSSCLLSYDDLRKIAAIFAAVDPHQ